MYAPQAITDVWNAVKAAMPQAQFGGITGSGKPGYHSPVNVNRARYPGNYSILRPDDLRGDFDAGRALDITLPRPQDMTLLTQRLINATLAGDKRMWPVREFFGTTNGRTVTGLDVRDGRWITSDNSHLWHIHISFYTVTATDRAALAKVADVLLGRKSEETIHMDMTRKQLEAIIDNRSRTVARTAIANAIRAYHQGGDNGWWTRARFPGWVKDAAHGIGDRVFALEKKVKP